MGRCCSNRITTEMVVIANTSARKATATQNRRSVLHHPAIRSVATTDVAHPLTMLTALAATAVRPLGSSPGRARRTTPGAPWYGGGCGGICMVGDSGTTGIGPVGARRMIRVCDSERGEVVSGGGAEAGGSLGEVTSASVVADVKSPLSQPWDWVDSFGAPLQHLKVQVRPGGIAAVAHGGDLVAGHHALTDADQRGVDVAVERDRAVGMTQLDPRPVAGDQIATM